MKNEKPLVTCVNVKDAYSIINKVIDRYMDMKPKYRKTAAVWLLSMRNHDLFETFSYLYLNAMKGSGKTRFMKLMSFMVDGDLTTSITESIIFRENTPLFIDEAESISNKEQAAKRELLNVAYKKGGVVKRTERNSEGEFEVRTKQSYRPICLANIDGLDDVLLDRCIPIILEKSFNSEKTRRLEMFHLDRDVMVAKEFLLLEKTDAVSVVSVGLEGSKKDIKTTYEGVCIDYMMRGVDGNDTNNTHNTQHTNNTNNTTLTEQGLMIVEKIEKTDLMGRDLELWMPLFVTSSYIGEDVLDEIISIAQEITQERQQSNIMENPDVVLIGFLMDYMKDKSDKEYISMSDIVVDYNNSNPGDDEWFNAKWLGRALIRNSLKKSSRRLGKGREVMLDKDKIMDKAKKFGLVEDLSSWTSNMRGRCEFCEAGNRDLIRFPDPYQKGRIGKYCGECFEKLKSPDVQLRPKKSDAGLDKYAGAKIL